MAILNKLISNKELVDYAKVIVKVGVNVQKNQIVVIRAILESKPLVVEVVKQCYACGAKKIIIQWDDIEITRLKYINESIETLTTMKQYEVDSLSEPIITDKACIINIRGSNPNGLKDVNPEKMSKAIAARSKYLKPLSNWTMAGKSQWTIACWPSIEWSRIVFPKDSDEKAQQKLMKAILKTVRVDGKKDPLPLWKKHNAETTKWAAALNKANYDYLHFENKLGTNIDIALVKNHIWGSGEHGSTGTAKFTANLPTEEVWCMPDMNGLNGKVIASKPLSYNGNLIDKFWFEFKNGEVVKYDAKIGKKVLDQIFKIEGAKRTGEIALVPKTSPINLSKVLFFSTLYDENAACHIALGASYPTNIKNGTKMTREELKKLGSNDSAVHIDFMFGTDDMNVWGYKNGKKTQIFKNGLFVNM